MCKHTCLKNKRVKTCFDHKKKAVWKTQDTESTKLSRSIETRVIPRIRFFLEKELIGQR